MFKIPNVISPVTTKVMMNLRFNGVKVPHEHYRKGVW